MHCKPLPMTSRDLALVDVGNPAIDGLAFLRRLRSASKGAVVPALLLSWDTRAAAHADAIEAGADDLIGKPFAAAELLARVGAHMRLASERRALHRRLTDHTIELEAQVARRTAALAASEAQFKADLQSRSGHPLAHRRARPASVAERPMDAVHGRRRARSRHRLRACRRPRVDAGLAQRDGRRAPACTARVPLAPA